VLNGYATSFAYHPQKSWIVHARPGSVWAPEPLVVRGTGIGYEWLDKAPDVEDAWDTVKSVLGEGRVLEAAWLDDFVIAGYREGRRPAQRQVFVVGKRSAPKWIPFSEFVDWHSEFGRMAFATSVQKRPEPELAIAREVLERALAWSVTDQRARDDGMRDASYGLEGMLTYARDLAASTASGSYIDNAWYRSAIKLQSAARRSMAVWLERKKACFESGAAEELARASGMYREACALWGQLSELLITPELEEDAPICAECALLVNRACDAERTALAHIAKALQASA
jgi:hypothetical protein